MAFVAISTVMVLAAMACVVLPLLLRHRGAAATDVMVLKTHNKALAVLERRLKQGELDMPGYLSVRKRLEKEFQAQLAQQIQPEAQVAAFKPSRITAALVALALPVFAVGMYAVVGNWPVAKQGVSAGSADSVNQMVAKLEERLNTSDPNDAEGWQMLGRSYVVLGRYAEAMDAYAHAYALRGDSNPDLLADYSEAIVLADRDKLTTEAAPLLEKALRQAPENPKALWYGGQLALAQHRNALAIQRWRKLLDQNPSAEIRQLVEQHIKEAGGSVIPPAAVGITTSLTIPVHVMLSSKLAGQMPSGASLFVFVQPVGGKDGPPLLVKRLSADKLPADIVLTSADAMMPGVTLTDHKRYEITARLSLHGDAVAQRGDMEGDALFDSDQRSQPVIVTIDQRVP